MSLIIIIATIWGISALISHSRQARLAEEQKRQREAQARLLREQRTYAQAQREETARLIALEKARQAQEKMNEKFEREQARQAEQLAKHEERLLRLEQKLELAQREEDHYSDEVSAIRIDMAGLEGYINYCKAKGLLCKGKEAELEKLNKKLFAAETKMIKARQARELCEMQMSA